MADLWRVRIPGVQFEPREFLAAGFRLSDGAISFHDQNGVTFIVFARGTWTTAELIRG